MARGAVRGAAVAWLGLIALDALVTNRGAGAVSGALGVVQSVIQRALSPDVAAIPDYSKKHGAADGGTNPVVTGQASNDGSSGHNYDLPVDVIQRPTDTLPIYED